ncbi:MAG: hypothetical protein PHV18_12760 [Lachnospiraceae bacterium]|nr:hypothetical protein [Lachnospiraceae bacterium]
MVQKTIENLYYGNISPSEQLDPQMPNFKRKHTSAWKNEEAFMSELTEEQSQRFQEVMMKRMGVSSYEVTQAFVDGFKLATRLMAEVFLIDVEDGNDD